MKLYRLPDGRTVTSIMLPREIQKFFTITDYLGVLYENNSPEDVDYMTRQELEDGYHEYIGEAYLSQPWRMAEELGIVEV